MKKALNKINVAVAMSGGVDSSVAAALAIDKYGKENVFGVTMKLYCYGDDEATDKSCCSLDAINDAASVCSQLGIKHYVVNVEEDFQREVIDNFISEYQAGRTPNPCVRCNQIIKFETLLNKVERLGANILATGHYAKISQGKSGIYHLMKGDDAKKDQSYFLYNLDQNQLAKVWFPLGEISKTKTREIASSLDLKTAQKAESQDICFVTSDLPTYLGGKVKLKPGNIVDKESKIYGKHLGLSLYTIGQRKGLGGGFKSPMFVVALNVENNELVIGPKKDLYKNEFNLKNIHWNSGKEPKMPLKCKAKIRYNMPEAECEINFYKNGYLVTFKTPQLSVTPGQSVVFYESDYVVGGGVI
jgi:tRNA-specific 2-thiouridylase